jgi:AraC family transcriptional regulator
MLISLDEHMKAPNLADRVKIVDCEDIKVAVYEHRGDPRRVDESVRRFVEWRKQNHLSREVSATFNILYNDPTQVAPEDFRVDLCAATDRDVAENDFGVIGKTIPGGRCAVLRHVGSDDGLGTVLRYLCSEWLAQSGETLRDFPIYLQRVKFYPEVAENEAIVDVFLPLA